MSDKRVTVWVQVFKDRPHLVLQWHDPQTGRRRSQSAGTNDPKEAEKKRADKEYELNHGLHKDVSRLSWESFRELFEAEYVAGLRPETRTNYGCTFDIFERLCQPKALRSITERTLSRFVAAMRQEPGRAAGTKMMASTMRVHLQFLHTALAWAVEQKMLPVVPTFPSVKVPKKKPQPVPLESFERLLDKAPDQHMRTYLLCGWLCGLRRNEALLLAWEPVEDGPYLDLARDRIVFPAEFVKAVEDQWIPLDPVLRQALEAMPRQGKRVFHFTNERTGEPLKPLSVGARVIQLAHKAGVKLTMKSLRRGFGCRYAGKVPAQVLQRLMRHANIKTTTDYYANVDEAVEEAVLGAKRNRPRNTAPDSTPQTSTDSGTTSHPNKSSV